ncbi:hypothetical protein N0V85_007806 [Neurospora sp. IMI 360204]|nr:hypothetical protein N0V85_007806 [Neurospora sp. IMI 360204]
MAPNVTEASKGLDSSGRALTRPEEANTTRPNVYTELRGQVHAPAANDEASKSQILTIAERFEGRMATPYEITLTFFTSASCQPKPNRETVGAYSVVFTEMSANANDHGKQAEMAWGSNLLGDWGVAEALAVVQAVQVANQRLRTLPPGSGGPKFVTVQIFTGAFNVLREIALNDNTWSASRSPIPHLELLRSVQSMMFEHTHRLGEIANVEVDLHLYWLSGKCRLESQLSPKRVAIECRLHDGEHNMFTLNGEAKPASEIPPPVYLAPDVEQALVHKNKNHKKKLEKKSAAARVRIASQTGYQDSWYGQSYDPCPEPYISSFSNPEDFYDSDLEVHNSIEASPEPSYPRKPEPDSSEPPPMGGPADMVSDIPFPGTDKPMWWRDLCLRSETEEECDEPLQAQEYIAGNKE